jgi:CHAP domain-containing protein
MRPTMTLRSAPWALCLALLLPLIAVALSASSAGAAATSTSPSSTSSSARATTTVVVAGCAAYTGAKALGSYYSDSVVRVSACGQRPSYDGARNGSGPVVRPFAGSTIYYRGYQCIELVARFLKVRYGANPGVANGAQAVDRYAAAYPAKFVKIANGTKGKAPRKGDVLSLASNKSFGGVGHTGIVVTSTVNSAGNGTMRALEQNWGGTGGTSGYHNYTVKNWRVVYAGLPYIKWLRSR